MRIAGWHIEGFGVFSDWRVDDVPEGLSLLYGPNEAGKSTLLGFLRFALFGFRGGNAKELRYPPVAGGRHGGRLWLIGEDTLSAFGVGEDTQAAFGGGEGARAGVGGGAVRVERIAAPARKLLVTLSGDVPGDAGDLERLLGHADRSLFQNVFAFSLAELQSLASLGEEGVQDHIFSAGITGAGRSARDALRRIDAEAGALYRVSRKGKSRIRELADDIASCDGELVERRGAAEAYPDLAAEERAMAARLEALHAETERQREAGRQAEKLGELWREVRSPMEAARRQLAELPAPEAESVSSPSPQAACVSSPSPEGLPADAVRVLERRLGAVESAGAALESIEEDRRACRRKLDALVELPALATVADEVETLHRQLSLYETHLKERPLQRQNLATAESALRDALASLGADWDEARPESVDASLESVDRATQWADRLAASAADRAELDRKRAELEERRERLSVRIAGLSERRDALGALAARTLDERAAALRGLRARLAESATARARLQACGDAVECAVAGAGRGIVARWAAPAAAGLAALAAAPVLASRALRAGSAGESLTGEPRILAAAEGEPRILAAAEGEPRILAAAEGEPRILAELREWGLEAEAALQESLPAALPVEALAPAALAIATLLAGVALLLLLLRRQESRRRRDELEELEGARARARALLGEHLRELARTAAALGLSSEPGVGQDPSAASGEETRSALGEGEAPCAAPGAGEGARDAFGGAEQGHADPGVGEQLDRAEAQLEEERRRRQEWERLELLAEEAGRELDECRRELDLLEPCVGAAARRHDEREAGWREWKRQAGAPEGLAPATLPRFFELVQQASASLEARDRVADELQRREAESRAWEERAARALTRAGIRVDAGDGVGRAQREAAAAGPGGEPCAAASESRRGSMSASAAETQGTVASAEGDERAAQLLEAFAELRRRCREDQRVREGRQPLEERSLELDDRRTAAAGRLAGARETLDSLFEAAGVEDEEGFRRGLELREKRRALEEQIRSGEGELDRRLGRGAEASECRAELARGRVAEWEREAGRAREAAAGSEAERDELLRRHQDLRGRLAELEATSAVAELELQRAELAEELDAAVAEWRRLRVARSLIEATLERFERERQPAVLDEASRYFETVTAGRYRRILQSAGSEAFEVVDAEDRRKKPAELSRGTAEQLYVCIRLGLIAEFARRSKRLPVVMDDVLVNFDDARARAMVGVLDDFAARTRSQVLFFSCSERTRELFAAAAPDAPLRQLPS